MQNSNKIKYKKTSMVQYIHPSPINVTQFSSPINTLNDNFFLKRKKEKKKKLNKQCSAIRIVTTNSARKWRSVGEEL